MTKSLVIVESPAKAKTINKYLGSNFVVKSSVGHIRDLPTKSQRAAGGSRGKKLSPEEKKRQAYLNLVQKMAVDPENDWQARYEIVPGKEKVLSDLKKAAKDSDTIYLATDLDREGEAIAWHLKEAIGGDESRYKRVIFSEITKNAIRSAFDSPTKIDENRVNAQQARRFLDRVVGFMISPLLWKRIARGLSAGRVQSVAVRLVAEREREISIFRPEEYWEIFAAFAKDPGLSAQVVKYKDKPFRPSNKDSADEALALLRSASYSVDRIEKKPVTSRPPPPFITSTLQQAASVRLRFGVKKTMTLAQKLYENGYITYMRTDSVSLSKDALEMARGFIGSRFSSSYLPEKPNFYQSKKGAQEAHEGIRPTDVERIPETLSDVDDHARKLYELIWRQFLACQMAPAKHESTSVHIRAGDYLLRAKGRILLFDGWQKVLPPIARKGDDANVLLPSVQEGEVLSLDELKPSQHFTKPPPRFTEASLVKELEKRGIGRPSTYASIISTIQDRGYVLLQDRRFHLMKMGDIVTNRLKENFTDLMDYSFTANMEEKLDKVAEGEYVWLDVLNSFFGDFKDTLESAEERMRPNEPTETDILCPNCQRAMMIRNGTTGVFLGCSGYALSGDEKCTKTINLVPGEESRKVSENDEEGDLEEIQGRKRCPKCESMMVSYLVDETRRLHVCSNNPDCEAFVVEKGQFKIKGYDGPIIECDKCSADMQLKTGRFGKYFGCSRYPECKNTRKLLRNGEAAPPRADPVPMPELKCEKSDGYFVLRDGAAGVFLASSNYPRSRETRSPLVEDLKRHFDELDPKFHFLANGPVTDPEGRKVTVKFSRKTKSYFLSTFDDDGKASGWSAVWKEGKWEEVVAEKKKSSRSAPSKSA